jgi:hypothetical protein
VRFLNLPVQFLHQTIGRLKAREQFGSFELEFQQMSFQLLKKLGIIGPMLDGDRAGRKGL